MESKKKAAKDPATAGQPRRKRATSRALNLAEPKIPVAFRLPASLVEQLDAMAARRGVDRSALLHELLERGFLGASLEEMTALALEKIAGAAHSNDALMATLQDVADRLAALETAVKK